MRLLKAFVIFSLFFVHSNSAYALYRAVSYHKDWSVQYDTDTGSYALVGANADNTAVMFVFPKNVSNYYLRFDFYGNCVRDGANQALFIDVDSVRYRQVNAVCTNIKGSNGLAALSFYPTADLASTMKDGRYITVTGTGDRNYSIKFRASLIGLTAASKSLGATLSQDRQSNYTSNSKNLPTGQF